MGHINRKVTLNIDEATFAGKTYINQGKQCLFATITIIMTINLDWTTTLNVNNKQEHSFKVL